MAHEDRFLRGSDHSSFTSAGYPAVVFREAREGFARQHERRVGDVTRLTLPGMTIDDWVFGVAAVGADGQESLVSAYVAPVRRLTEVELVKQGLHSGVSAPAGEATCPDRRRRLCSRHRDPIVGHSHGDTAT